MDAKSSRGLPRTGLAMVASLALIGLMLAGCADDECATCVETAPVAPTGVYSQSGDGQITLFWTDFPEFYGSIDHYRIYSRRYVEPEEEWVEVGRVSVGQNYDGETGQYYYIDAANDVVNGTDYEYAVAAVATSGLVGDWSFELVVDTPLPMSAGPIQLWDTTGANRHLSGFDFRTAAYDDDPYGLEGRVDPTVPNTTADVRVVHRDGILYLEAVRSNVQLQDYGTATDADGGLFFELLSWAPRTGYSATGVLELIEGHIYVVRILNEVAPGSEHFAKLGVEEIDLGQRTLTCRWAYQLIDGLPELSVPQPAARPDGEFVPIRL
jgi:hypothetical protein